MLTYAERIEKAGYEVKECRTMKEFCEELKAYSKETEENPRKDIAIEVYYKNGETFCHYPYVERKGTIKNSGIKTAIIVTKTRYITYKYDLSEEWEQIKEKLSEEEAEAIELGISIENYRIYKKTADNFHKPETEEQEATPEEKPAKSTENSVEETTEEPEAEEPKATPEKETTKNTENSVFGYKINILEALKEAGYTSTRIRKEKLFAQVTLQKFRAGDTNISLQTVADICNLTGLQPWNILSFSAKSTENSAEETTEEVTEEPATKEQETTSAEDTTKSTENSAEETTEEVTEEPATEEQETTSAEDTTKSTENSAEETTEEVTEEPATEKQETINFEIPENLENEEIEKLDLTMRTYNATKKAGIHKIKDLKEIKTTSEFERKIGKKYMLREIIQEITNLTIEKSIEKQISVIS